MAKVKVLRYAGQRSWSWSRSLGQKFWHDGKGLITRNKHVKYESSTFHGSKVMAKVKVFRNVGQRSRSRSQGHRPCHFEGFHKLNIHAKYEASISYGLKVMTKVKVLFESKTDRTKTRCSQFLSVGIKNPIHFFNAENY